MRFKTEENQAIKFALQNPAVKLPRMAAVLWADGQMFVGYNSFKTHPLAKKFSKDGKSVCLHAEIDALRRCIASGVSPEGGVMHIARVLKNGTPALAKPCAGCQSALVAFNLKKVIWTENIT